MAHSHKYDGVNEKYIPILERYEIEYFRENKDVPFCGLTIHPIKIRDYEAFLNCLPCLTLNRKSSAEGLAKSDLGYLNLQMRKPDSNPDRPDDKEWVSGRVWSFRFQKLIEMVFGIKNGVKCNSCGHVIPFGDSEWESLVAGMRASLASGKQPEPLKCPKCQKVDSKEDHIFSDMIRIVEGPTKAEDCLIVDGHRISLEDFELFRYIVPFQNMPDYRDDSRVDPKLRQDFEKRAEMLNKKNGGLTATLERKVIAVSMMTGFDYQKLYDFPMRTFNQMFSMIRGRDDYRLAKLLTSVFPPEKGKPAPDIGDWVYEKDEDMYSGVYHDLEEQKSGLGTK